MGWWLCNENGGINWGNKPSGHAGGLINAIPGRDTTEDYYNGDAPADAMYVTTAVLKELFGDNYKPTKEQLTNLFILKEYHEVFDFIDREKLEELISRTWEEIDKIYMEEWSRPAYKEERYYICQFSFGGANRVNSDWWKISKNDRKYLANYKKGKWLY